MTLDELLAVIGTLDDEQGASNYEENNFEAGWHAFAHELTARVQQ